MKEQTTNEKPNRPLGAGYHRQYLGFSILQNPAQKTKIATQSSQAMGYSATNKIPQKQNNWLHIVGTSHVAVQSITAIEQAIQEYQPNIIAIELDKQRLTAVMNNENKSPGLYELKMLGLKAWLIAIIGRWAEHTIGKKVNMTPGAEMKYAIELAQEHKIRIALIDQEIKITLKKLSKSIGLKEAWQLIKELAGSIQNKNKIMFDLRTVPEKKVITKLLEHLKQKYPRIHKTLVQERNEYMAQQLIKIHKTYPEMKILAIMGAGHEDEVKRITEVFSQTNI